MSVLPKADLPTAALTSAAIVTSFTILLTVASMLVVILAPRSFRSFPTVNWALALSFYAALDRVILEQVDSAEELLLYGIPLGLPLNIAISLLAGAALGLAVHFFEPSRANDSIE